MALYTGWTFFTYPIVVKFVMVFEMTEINEKEAGVGPFFKEQYLHICFVKRTVLKFPA